MKQVPLISEINDVPTKLFILIFKEQIKKENGRCDYNKRCIKSKKVTSKDPLKQTNFSFFRITSYVILVTKKGEHAFTAVLCFLQLYS